MHVRTSNEYSTRVPYERHRPSYPRQVISLPWHSPAVYAGDLLKFSTDGAELRPHGLCTKVFFKSRQGFRKRRHCFLVPQLSLKVIGDIALATGISTRVHPVAFIFTFSKKNRKLTAGCSSSTREDFIVKKDCARHLGLGTVL